MADKDSPEGKHSILCCKTLLGSMNRYIDNHRPVSTRTRSQTRQRNDDSAAQAAAARLTTPSTGRIIKTGRITRTQQTRAHRRLCRSRLKLRSYLTSDRWRRDVEANDLPDPTPRQIEQLGILDRNGLIQSIPRSARATWNSDLRMIAKKARRRAGRSRMIEVEYNYTEEELDELFGLLPGEDQSDELDWDAHNVVLEQLTAEGRVEEGLWDGENAEGVWRNVKIRGIEDKIATTVTRWAAREGRAWKLRVMDPCCVKIVGGVWQLKNM